MKSHNFETLTILYMYIPLRTTKFFPKNVGYAREYPGTSVGPPMHGAHHDLVGHADGAEAKQKRLPTVRAAFPRDLSGRGKNKELVSFTESRGS